MKPVLSGLRRIWFVLHTLLHYHPISSPGTNNQLLVWGSDLRKVMTEYGIPGLAFRRDSSVCRT